MRKNLVVGILRENKELETRAPLTPKDVGWLIKREVDVEVESSNMRIFKDSEYKKKGARVLKKFDRASLLLGIKEPKPEELYREKIYMVFSHIIKGQAKNIPLLRSCIDKGITLVDYEKIVDSFDRRLIYFGRFAGICGLVDSLCYFGKKLEWKGLRNPFSKLKPAYKYKSLKAVKSAMEEVRYDIERMGFERELSPFIIGITGHGNVSKGVQEILDILHPIEIHPKNILRFVEHQKKMRHKVYKIVFLREEKFRSKKGKGFYFEEYINKPDNFESNMDLYLPNLNILIHTSYWDPGYPRMVTKHMVNKLAKKIPFRIEFIGDISCDINGAIELTCKATNLNAPTFTYNCKNGEFIEGYKSDGITIMAVDNLPSELPRDASIEFSSLIREYVYQISAHGIKDITNHIAIPREVRDAVITQGGRLAGKFNYLNRFI